MRISPLTLSTFFPKLVSGNPRCCLFQASSLWLKSMHLNTMVHSVHSLPSEIFVVVNTFVLLVRAYLFLTTFSWWLSVTKTVQFAPALHSCYSFGMFLTYRIVMQSRTTRFYWICLHVLELDRVIETWHQDEGVRVAFCNISRRQRWSVTETVIYVCLSSYLACFQR